MDDRSRLRRASDWLIELADRPADTDLRRRFDEWLAEDPANARDWAEIERTYALMGHTSPAFERHWASPPAATERPEPRRPRPRPLGRRTHAGSFRRRRAAAGVAAMALAACLGLAVLPGVMTRISADAVTGTAEVRSLTLADGSMVRLAPESAISASVTERERSVRVIEGKAFFEVRPDPQRPFRVGAETLEATVLGTAFEVARDGSSSRVAVQEGLVRVEAAGSHPPPADRLSAGDTVRVSASGAVTRGRVAPDQVAAWREGLLIANDRPVGEVVNELRRYYRGLLVLRGDDLAAQPLTGVYSLADPAAALEAIANAQGASVYRLSPWVLVIAGG